MGFRTNGRSRRHVSIPVCLAGRRGNRGYTNNLLCKSPNICLNLWLFSDPFPVNELFHSNSQHPDRRGDLTFWTQTVLALRGRDRLCGGSRARPAPGPGSIRALVANNCAALGNYRGVARAVPAKNCDRDASNNREGTLPQRALVLIREWARIHEQELLDAFERAAAFQPPGKIAPLE